MRCSDDKHGHTCSHVRIDADSDVEEAHPGLVMTSDDESDDDEPVTRVMSMQTTTATDNAISARNVRRMRAGPKVILDLCCGHCSMAMYYLEQDSQVYVIAIDNGLEKEEALRYIPAHMQHRV